MSQATHGSISEGSMISRKSLVRSKTYGREKTELVSMNKDAQAAINATQNQGSTMANQRN